MARGLMERVTWTLKESYRKNRGDLHGLLFGHYPSFVLNRRVQCIENEVIVFAFHSVEPERFERQLRYLNENGYHVLESADTMQACLQGAQPISPRSVLLTFDDGWESLSTVAFPLLQRYGFHAVSFIVPTFVGRPHFCTWEQLQEMQRSGVIDVQSHTLFHRFAPAWPRVVPCNGITGGLEDADHYPTMVEDYRRAKDVLEEKLGTPVRHLCYPDYDGTEASVAASRAAGYVSNFWGVIPGRKTNRKGDDPFHIARIVDDYLRCLPGLGRESLRHVAARRWQDYGRPKMARALGRTPRVSEPAGSE